MDSRTTDPAMGNREAPRLRLSGSVDLKGRLFQRDSLMNYRGTRATTPARDSRRTFEGGAPRSSRPGPPPHASPACAGDRAPSRGAGAGREAPTLPPALAPSPPSPRAFASPPPKGGVGGGDLVAQGRRRGTAGVTRRGDAPRLSPQPPRRRRPRHPWSRLSVFLTGQRTVF